MSKGSEVPEGLTREEREQYWRERRMEPFQDDPEMLEFIRTAKFDYDSTPEEDEEDIRIARARRNSKEIPVEVVLAKAAKELAEAFPDEAEYFLNWE